MSSLANHSLSVVRYLLLVAGDRCGDQTSAFFLREGLLLCECFGAMGRRDESADEVLRSVTKQTELVVARLL